MAVEIVPEPSDSEREAILSALSARVDEVSEWAFAALLEGVEPAEEEP